MKIRRLRDIFRYWKYRRLYTVVECYQGLSRVTIRQEKRKEAFSVLFESVKTCVECRGFLKRDVLKILLSYKNRFPDKTLSTLFVTLWIQIKVCILKNLDKLGYYKTWSQLSTLAVESNISVDPQSWTGIENVVNQETCLSFSYFYQGVLLRIPKASEAIHFRRLTANKKNTWRCIC